MSDNSCAEDPFANPAFLQQLIDAFPSLSLVVDGDVCVVAFNSAAGRTLNLKADALRKVTGDVLSCVNAHEDACGRTRRCRGCEVRCAINSALAGIPVERKKAKMELLLDGQKEEVHLLVTAKPVRIGVRTHVLLIAENVTDLVALQRVLPIVARCKLVGEDEKLAHALARQIGHSVDEAERMDLCGLCVDDLHKPDRRRR